MKYLKVYTDFVQSMEPLSDAERGRLFTAMLEYAEQGTEPDLRGNERFVWPTAKQNIDRQKSSYKNKVLGAEKAREAKAVSDIRDNQNDNSDIKEKELISTQDNDKDNDNEKERKKRKIFAPPSVDAVSEYCLERNNGIDAQAFVDFYTANGWVQGKGQKPIRDWKACIRTWEQHRRQDHAEQQDAAQVDKNKWAAWIRGEIE